MMPVRKLEQIKFLTPWLVKQGDEHGGHTVKRGGFFFGDGGQGQQRVESIIGVDHGGAVGDAPQIAHDHAETMIERHRDHQPIIGSQPQAFANHVTVVENVVMTEGRALGETGGARGVLNVHGLIEIQAVLALQQLLRRYAGRQISQLRPRQET